MNRHTWMAIPFVVALLSLPLRADEGSKAREDRIAERVQEWVDQEMSRFREELLAAIRDEMKAPTSRPVPSMSANTEFQSALQGIRAEEAFAHDAWLADDARLGRDTGTPGCDEAAQYIADHFKEDGLIPIGDDGTFFQHFTIGKTKKLNTQNVIGMVEGSDRKDEFVVVGAHYDHLGKGKMNLFNGRMGGTKTDDLYNGADDNASGTSGVLELAQAFAHLHPSRSIIFMTFAGEEKGLLGSYYYTAHPIRPLKQTVAMINMDMIGRNPDKAVQILGAQTSPELEAFAKQATEETGLKYTFPVGGVFGGSDHYPFYQKGLPVLFFFTGFHKDYHHATDHPDKISHEQLERVSRTAAICVWDAANTDETIEFKKLPSSSGGGRKPRLGVTPTDLDADVSKALGIEEGAGVQIDDVVEGSAAEKGGIQQGDVIVSFDGTEISSGSEELRDLIANAKPDTEIAVVVLRDGKKVELTVKLGK